MPYHITLTDGSFLTMVPDDTANTTSLPITLFGKGLTNYGEPLNDNFVAMLENFAGPQAPANAIRGMLWFDDTTQALRVQQSNGSWNTLAYSNSGAVTFNGDITAADPTGDSSVLQAAGKLGLTRAVAGDGPEIDFFTAAGGPATASIKLVNNALVMSSSFSVAGPSTSFATRPTVAGVPVYLQSDFDPATFVTQSELNLDGYMLASNYNPAAFVSATGGTISGDLVIHTPTGGDNNQLRLIDGTGAYGVLLHNDSQSFYILLTPQNQPNGSFNGFRPLAISLSTGEVTLNNVSVFGSGNVVTTANFNAANYLPITLPSPNGQLIGNLVVNGNVGASSGSDTAIVYAVANGEIGGGISVANDLITISQCDGSGKLILNMMQFDPANSRFYANIPLGLEHPAEDANLRLVDNANQYSVLLRNDGQNFYIMATNAGEPLAIWNSFRPFAFNLTTGNVSLAGNGSETSVGGNLVASGDVTALSDARLKSNVTTIDRALEKVRQMRGVSYTRKTDGKRSIGLIAQEVRYVLPELVSETEDGTLGVAYGNVVAVLIQAVKELSDRVDALTAERQ